MAKERPQYRQNLEWLNEVFPAQQRFTFRELADFFKMSPTTAYKWLKPYYVAPVGITKPALARALCERGE